MLNRMEIRNINSIGECILDFEKSKYSFLEQNVNGKWVNPVALYGHNGSGKSSVFKAVGKFIELMCSNVDFLTPFVVNQYSFNSFQKGINPCEDCLVGSILWDFELEDCHYEYYISTSRRNSIPEEYLKKDNRIVFSYKNGDLMLDDSPYPMDLGVSKLIPALRYLAAKQVDRKDLTSVYNYFAKFTFVDLPRLNSPEPFVTSGVLNNISKIDLMARRSKNVRDLLKNYDEFPLYTIEKEESIDGETKYYLFMDDMPKVPLTMDKLSDGMKNQSLLLSILLELPNNSILFVDELESALHPSAIMSFVSVIQEKGIQLLFSSHNTHILQHLRPDQVYFSKWVKGYSTYKRLSKLYPNIRAVNNIEKMYLSNVFDIGDEDEK